MRNVFIKKLVELASADERIVLLTADLGYMVLEPFAEKFPDRFFNVGVAEQNMLGIATGMAEAGYLPFVYSITSFVSLRPYEFLINGPAYHQLPVRIVGIGQGFDYGVAGHTHHALNTVGLIRMCPGVSMIMPASDKQAESALEATYSRNEPIFYNLSKRANISVPGLSGAFHYQQFDCINQGDDILWVTAGGIVEEVQKATAKLQSAGVSSEVLLLSTLSLIDTDGLVEVLGRFSQVITVEEQVLPGGVGSIVAEVIAEKGLDCWQHRFGVTAHNTILQGSRNYHLTMNKLDADALYDRALSIVRSVSHA